MRLFYTSIALASGSLGSLIGDLIRRDNTWWVNAAFLWLWSVLAITNWFNHKTRVHLKSANQLIEKQQELIMSMAAAQGILPAQKELN